MEEAVDMEVEEEQDQKMTQLEAIFQRKDAVTEPRILETIKQYVAFGGKPQTVVEMLSESYVGYGPMINVVLNWNSKFGLAEATDYKEEEQDCFWKFLSQIVRDNFNPTAFSDVFSSGGGIPEWFDELTVFPEGRQLIYDLTDQHRNCLFLNFAVHHILQQGFDKEVAAVGGSISGNFNVFNRLLIKKIEELYTAEDENTDAVLNQLFQMCCADEIKYSYSRLVLSQSFDTPYGGYFRRFAEELEAYAAKNAGFTIWKMKSLFLTESGYNQKNIEAAFCISSLLRSTSTVWGDVQKLSKMYKEEDHPSVDLLRCSELIEKLLRDLFASKRKLTDQHKFHIIELVKMAVVSETLDSASVDSHIAKAIACTESVSSGVKISDISLEFLDISVASIGIFQWLKVKLLDEEFLDSGTSLFPSMLQLMSEILERQPLQRRDILLLISKTLPLIGNSLPSFSKQMLDKVTILLVKGDVSLFCTFCKDVITQKFDRSLIRHLTMIVLRMVGPPYSVLFASTLLKLVTASGFEKVKKNDKEQLNKHNMTILSFLAACKYINFRDGSLGPKEEALLESIEN